MRRNQGNRLLHSNFVVLGDGLTEQFYLKHLKALIGYKYSIRPSLFASITIESVESIIDELLSGDCNQVIYFTDYDTIVNQGKKEKFDALVEKYSDIDEVLICETMPSIEFWFLLHFKKTTREFCDANHATQELMKFIKGYSKNKGFLENEKWVKDLIDNEKLANAIQNSISILAQKESPESGKHFPYSKIHLGINKFEEQKRKET